MEQRRGRVAGMIMSQTRNRQRAANRASRPGRTVRRGRGGFTLVEVMVAFTILGIGLLSVAGAQVKAIHGTQSGRHLSQASLVAQTQLDTLLRSSWTALVPAGWNLPTTVNSTVVDGGSGSVEQAYNVSWRITNLIPNETRQLDVRVIWAENDGRTRQVAASGIRFNRENL
jgi:prepilin-type N-terminal cleavage/methylation domain-containing protein